MGFALRIDFTGLCLFLPASDGKTLTVVLPDPSGMKMPRGRAMPSHRASVFYNSAYETGTGRLSASFREVLLSGATSFPGKGVKSKAATAIDRNTFSLANVADIAAAAYPPGTETTPEERNVDPKAINPTDKRISSVITITGGRLLSFDSSYPWYLHSSSSPVPLAWKIGWLIEGVDADSLLLETTGKNRLAPESHTLTPVGGAIELRVKNVVPEESMPEDPPYDPKATMRGGHFDAFYGLLKPPPKEYDTPHFGTPTGTKNTLGMLITCTPGVGQLGA